MYCQFGQKWAKLHHGPMWSVVPLHSSDQCPQSHHGEIVKVCMHVPSEIASVLYIKPPLSQEILT